MSIDILHLKESRLRQYNYFICHEKLSDNTALLNKNLNKIENFKKRVQIRYLPRKDK